MLLLLTLPTLKMEHLLVLVGLYLASLFLNLVLSKKSQIDAWAEANPRVAGVLKILRAMGLDPWGIVQGLTLLVQKKLPDYQKQTLAELTPPAAGAAPPVADIPPLEPADDRPTPVDHPPAPTSDPPSPPDGPKAA